MATPKADKKKTSKKTAAPKSAKASGEQASSGSADPSAATAAQYQLLQAPIVTEKTSMMTGDRNGAVFRVPRQATKTEIKAAVEAVFKVQVARVRTVNVLGKVKRARGSMGRTASFKKAYVTVKEGQTINIVEGV